MSDYTSITQEYEREAPAEYGQVRPSRKSGRSARPTYRTKNRPEGHNGMHRRRQKRFSW